MRWHAASETFIEQTEFPEPNYRDWIRGTYTASVPISDGPLNQECEVFVPLTLQLDFVKERDRMVQWTIDCQPTQIRGPAAYPGVHRGWFKSMNHGHYSSSCEVEWETPIFSPYVHVKSPYRSRDLDDMKPATTECERSIHGSDTMQSAGHVEKVFLGTLGYKTPVLVLQRILRDLSRLLVFGPRYENMQEVPIAPYRDLFKSPAEDQQRKAEFFNSPHFPDAARLFSRVFCRAGLAANESEDDPVPRAQCEASLQTIMAMLEHFTILREPMWVDKADGDWVDDLEAEAAALKTKAEWLAFERKWAIVSSYACGLDLHGGPWAGDDWRLYAAASG